MNKTTQVYVAPLECVGHLYNDDNNVTDRDAFKRATLKCGEVLSLIDFERECNLGNVSTENHLFLID